MDDALDELQETIIEMMKSLPSDDQRLEVMARFCAHCGSVQPDAGMACQCWNDE